MNYYKRHLGDYAKDTGWLSTYQHGVFALLLDWYYANEKAIPIDLAYRIVKARSGPERKATEEVLLAFFDLNKHAGFAHNKHADEVLSKYHAKCAANALIAQEREGTKRARNVGDSAGGSSNSGEPSHKPLAISHKEDQKKPAARSTPKIDLQAFLAECEAQGEAAIPPDDAVFAYADSIHLPHDFVSLAWGWFKARYAGKKQAGVRGWRQTFRNAVEGNWPKFWYADDAGGWGLTTAGKQAARAAK